METVNLPIKNVLFIVLIYLLCYCLSSAYVFVFIWIKLVLHDVDVTNTTSFMELFPVVMLSNATC